MPAYSHRAATPATAATHSRQYLFALIPAGAPATGDAGRGRDAGAAGQPDAGRVANPKANALLKEELSPKHKHAVK